MLARDRGQRPQSYRARAATGSRAPLLIGAAAVVIAAGVAVSALAFGGQQKPAQAPAVAPAPAAPVAITPTAPATAAPIFGEPQPLIRIDGGVLAGWKPQGDGQWALSEDVENALSGSHGMFLHPLEAKPVRLEAELHPASSKMLGIGVAVGEDVTVLMVKNLSAAYIPSIEAGDRSGKQWLSQSSGGTLRATDQLPVSVTVAGKTLTATVGGVDLKPVALSGAPTEVVLFVDPGEGAPAQVGHLTVRYAP
jgi:hypothetical protein